MKYQSKSDPSVECDVDITGDRCTLVQALQPFTLPLSHFEEEWEPKPEADPKEPG